MSEETGTADLAAIDKRAVWKAIEEHWESRCKAQCYGDKDRLKHQAEFFSGAMAALNAVGLPNESVTPPKWWFSIIRGEVIRADSDSA